MFFLLPYANMLLMSFFAPAKSGPYEPVLTLGNYAVALGDPFQWQVLARTLKLGFLTTAFTLVLGYPLAWNLARASGRLKGALLVLLISPLLVGVVIRSFGWMVLLADNGLVNSLLARLGSRARRSSCTTSSASSWARCTSTCPSWCCRSRGRSSTSRPTSSWPRAAWAPPSARAFWRVVFPLSLPGVFAGCLLVFVLAVSSYVIPVLLGGFKVLTTPLLVVQTAIDVNNWPGAAAQAVVLFAASLVCIGVYFVLMNRAMRGLRG